MTQPDRSSCSNGITLPRDRSPRWQALQQARGAQPLGHGLEGRTVRATPAQLLGIVLRDGRVEAQGGQLAEEERIGALLLERSGEGGARRAR